MRTVVMIGAAAWSLALADVSAAEPAGRLSAQECAVWAQEKAFAGTVARKDASAFASFIAADAAFAAGTDAPVHGRAAIVADWADILTGAPVHLEWRPAYVTIGGDPNLALSSGPYAMDRPDDAGGRRWAIGSFTTIWRRSAADAPWRVVLDTGSAPTPVGSQAAARAHLDAAPNACPGISPPS